MNNISDQVLDEILREEISQIMFFIDRHNRWKLQAANLDEIKQHNVVVDFLKGAAEVNDALLENIRIRYIKP